MTKPANCIHPYTYENTEYQTNGLLKHGVKIPTGRMVRHWSCMIMIGLHRYGLCRLSLFIILLWLIVIMSEADYVPDEDESSDDSETLLEEEMLAQRDETLNPVDEINELEAVSLEWATIYNIRTCILFHVDGIGLGL